MRFCAKSSEQEKRTETTKEEREREREREREGDSAWVVGGGFWLKIAPLSFSPLAAAFFVWQALATAAIQVAAKMKEKYLCQCLIGCSLELDA